MKKAFTIAMLPIIVAAACASVFAQEHSRPTPNPTPKPATVPNPDGWVTFNSEIGRFTVSVPEIPPEKTETTPSEHGPYTTHLFLAKGTNSLYLIGWVDYDPNFNFNKTRELEANRDNFIKGVNATLVTSRPISIDGYESLEFTAETEEKVFRSRVFMVGRRPYQLVTATTKGVDDSVNIERFFGSFKVSVR